MTREQIIAMIRERAALYGLDPDMMVRRAQVESGFNPSAGNPKSTASGLFQFTAPTWERYGKGDPHDPLANIDAGMRFTKDNLDHLRAAGLPVNAGTAHLAHFAGPQGAVNLLKADPSTPVGSIMGEAAMRANPFLGGMTVADLQAWANRKMGGPAPMPGATTPTMTAQAPSTPMSLSPASAQSNPMMQAMQIAQLFGSLAPAPTPQPAPAPVPMIMPPRPPPRPPQEMSYEIAAPPRRLFYS